MTDMAEKPVFDHAKADLGIKMVCEQFDKLEMTMTERFHVSFCVAVTAAAMLGKSFEELAAMYKDE